MDGWLCTLSKGYRQDQEKITQLNFKFSDQWTSVYNVFANGSLHRLYKPAIRTELILFTHIKNKKLGLEPKEKIIYT